MKKVLIIGGTGFLGLHLCRRLVDEGYDVTIIARDFSGVKHLSFVSKVACINGSITDIEKINNVVAGKDYVINLATIIDKKVKEGIAIESLNVNCLGELHVLESIRLLNTNCHHIFIGSRAQFGRVGTLEAVKENYPQNPFWFYAIHKHACELYAQHYEKIYGVKIAILRVSSIMGENIVGNPNNVIPYFIQKARASEPLIVWGDGTDVKDFIYVNDLVDLLLLSMRERITGIYNVGSGTGLRMIDAVSKIRDICGSSSEIQLKNLTPAEEMFNLDSCVMDVTKIKEATGWVPKTTFEESVKIMRDYYGGKS